MKAVNLKYKYIFASLCLLVAFFSGYHNCTAQIIDKKYISLVYSFSEDEIGHGKFEELIKQEFRKQRIEPIFDRFYKSDEFEQGSGISYLQDHC